MTGRLILSMSVSIDGFISDRDGNFDWSGPSAEQFAFHTEEVRALGGYVSGRRLYETMLPWETDPSMRSDEAMSEFADVWSALPKVVFSRTLDRVEGNAQLATASLTDEISAVRASTEMDVAVGGADLGAQAFELGLVDDLRIFRYPVVVGGGTPLLPPVTAKIDLELVATRTFGDRVVFEHYQRSGAILEG